MSSAHSFLRRLTVVLPAALALAWAPAALAAPPALLSLNPSSATAGGAEFTLILNGANFTPGSILIWDETPMTANFKSAEQLTAVIPASLIASAGTASVAVISSGGVSSRAALTINPPPTFSSPGAASAAAGNGSAVSIQSAGFPSALSASAAETLSTSAVQPPAAARASLSASSAAMSEAASTASLSSSAQTIQATPNSSAAQPAAAVHTSMVSSLSGVFSGAALNVTPPAPTIASMSPVSVVTGCGAMTLTVNGANFLSGSLATVVRWNSTALTTTYVSSTQVTAAVPASLTASAGTVNISVVTTGGITPNLPFTVNQAVPAITSETPSKVIAGYGAFILTVSGTNLVSPSTVYWGTTPLVTTHYTSSSLLAQVPANLVANQGTFSLTVTTVGGTSAPVNYTVGPPVPVITSLSPSSAAAGGAAFTLTITGTGFVPGIEVLWGITWVKCAYVSPTEETATIPASLIATAVQTGVVIYYPGVGWSRSAPFTVTPAPPAITSMSPASATAGGAGFMLTVNGTAFTQGETSMWNTSALDTIYVSPTQLIISVPASLVQFSGAANITITTPAGTSPAAVYTINEAAPQINALSPGQAAVGQGDFPLAISGNYFTSDAVVKWGSTALATTYISANQLTATVPANLTTATGTARVTVTEASGTSSPATLPINPLLQITTTVLPAATAGSAYTGPIHVTGGSPGYTWTVTGLPEFLTYNITFDNTLYITGTPVSPGTFTFQVSVEDTAGSVAGPVTLTINVAAGPSSANNSSLNGTYVCLMQGSVDTDGTRWAIVASFQADGQGNFTSGVFDTNSYDIGSGSGILSGTYSIGSDNNGMASIHTILTYNVAGIQTTQWAIAISGAAQPARQFRMIEADDQGTLPSNQQATANCYQATASAFALSTITGSSFAFGLDGEDNSGNMKATVGLFSASAGNIASGNIDSAQGGSATVQSYPFTATYTAPDPASGRFTMNLKNAGNSTGFTVYIIDANRMFLLDNTNDDGEQAGNMRTQQQSSYSDASLGGPFVLYARGAEFNSSGNAPSGFYSHIFQGTGDGAGNLAINQGYTDDDGLYSTGQSIGSSLALTFDPAHPGRATFPSASGTTFLYLFNTGSAFEMSVGDNGSLESGWLEPQTQTAFTGAALAGNYLFANLSQLNILPAGSVGVLGVASSGAMSAAFTTTSRAILSWDQSTSTTYNWDATVPGTGTFLVASNADGESSCAVISATKFVCTPQTDLAPSVQIFEQ